ncbi:MAG: hypothetical protein V1866_07085 [archaeon]
MIPSLEERLKNIDKDSLKEALLAPLILPRERMGKVGYLKYNITDNLQKYLQEKGVSLYEKPKYSVGQNLYSTIRKEPLKQVQYGMINCENIGRDVFKALTDWEAIYFMAGVWKKKSTRTEDQKYNDELLAREPVELIVAETIAAGIYRLKNVHEHKSYKTEPELPYSEEILQRYYSLRNSFMGRDRGIQEANKAKAEEKKPEQLKFKF